DTLEYLGVLHGYTLYPSIPIHDQLACIVKKFKLSSSQGVTYLSSQLSFACPPSLHDRYSRSIKGKMGGQRRMDWETLLAYISGSVDEELLLRNEYLVAENRILRDQLKGRIRLSDAERQTLAEIGKKLGKQALKEVATIVKPDTILG